MNLADLLQENYDFQEPPHFYADYDDSDKDEISGHIVSDTNLAIKYIQHEDSQKPDIESLLLKLASCAYSSSIDSLQMAARLSFTNGFSENVPLIFNKYFEDIIRLFPNRSVSKNWAGKESYELIFYSEVLLISAIENFMDLDDDTTAIVCEIAETLAQNVEV